MLCEQKNLRLASFATTAAACAGFALLFLATCSSQREISEGVQFILNTPALEPATTFELRFDQPVAAAEEVGQRATNSPLVITPPISGNFVWLSRRSGLFTPIEPAELGQAYHFSLRAGWRAGESSARLARTLRTPPMTVIAAGAWETGSSNAPSEPEIKLQFNVDVSASDARTFLDFRNAEGARVPAEARQATATDYFNYSRFSTSAGSQWTWNQQFRRAATNASPAAPVPGDSDDTSEEPISNRIVVWPARPLPVGRGWKLVVEKALPSPETRSRLLQPYEVPVGNVTPFRLDAVSAENSLARGRRLILNFSKPISSTINTNNWADWISVSPRPANLSASIYPSGIGFSGEFSLNTRYAVHVQAGFPAEESFTLVASTNHAVEISPLPPRLYFPAFSTVQMEGGSRRFPLLALNVADVQIRAKQLDRHTLIHALRGFGSYYKRYGENYDYLEPYRELDFNLVPGRAIFDRVLHNPSPRKQGDGMLAEGTDAARKIPLEWDEILGPGETGAVFLEAQQPVGNRQAGRPGTQALVQITDLGVLWKWAREEVTVYVFSHATGKPIPDVTLSLMSEDNEPLALRTTDAEGLARFTFGSESTGIDSPLSQEKLPRELVQGRRGKRQSNSIELFSPARARWLMAEAGADIHATPIHENGLSLYAFGIPLGSPDNATEKSRMLLFSDRPVYRPGETVHLKAILRDWIENRLAIPSGATGSLRCFDSKGQKFHETNVIFSALGSWADSVLLPHGVLGQYRVELQAGGDEFGRWFQVQEFQPNAFEISLTTKSSYPAGEKLEFPLSAKYYMGKGLSRAKVRWSLEAWDSHFAPEGYDGFIFGTAVYQEELARGSSSIAVQGEGVLSNQTAFAIAPELTFNPNAPEPRSAQLFVEVTDLNQQTLARHASFTCFSSDFYLGLKQFKDVVREGQPVPIEVIAVQSDGSPRMESVQAHLTFQHIEWHTVRAQGAGRARVYRSEPIITNILEREVTTLPARRVGDKWEVQSASNNPVELVPSQPGLYLVELRARDAGGREIVTAVTFNVSGEDALAWNYRNETQLELVADQKTYRAGDTATLLIKAPCSGTALVTVEREKVMRSFVTELSGNAPAIRVPLGTNDAPNVFVSVMLVRGANDNPKKFKSPEYHVGYCQLNVATPENKLDISIHPDRADYRPGDVVHLTTTVKNSLGQPAPDVEVTLYAVDEGILSLTGYPMPDPYSLFYKERPLSVRCGISLPNLLPEDPDQLGFQNKGFLIGGGGRSSHLRKNFLPCAFWNATLLTSEAGEVEARFAAPDSLTRYRVIAVAHSARSQFGSEQASFQINKPLMLEPALPRFANVTDRILARAVVHNQTDQPGEIAVTLQLDDKAKAGREISSLSISNTSIGQELSRSLQIGARSSKAIEFPLEFTDAGTAKWIWKAQFANEATGSGDGVPPRKFTDSVESTLPIGHVTPLMREIHLSRTKASETNLLLRANPQLLEGKGAVTVSISNTRLSDLGEAAAQLLHYPYGCVEQTSSSLLPWLVLRDAPAVLGQFPQTPAEVEGAIQAGIRRLFSMQTQSGGLSYWPGGTEPMLWGSAYGGMALALAARQGLPLPQANLDRLLDYLSQQLRQPSQAEEDQNHRCLALYTLALAGRGEGAYHELLFGKRELLSGESRALLALAILESKGPAAMVETLLNSHSSNRAREADDFGCDARDVAVRLLAWTHHQPAAPSVDVLVEELMNGQTKAHWGTTQGNAWALYALTEYAHRVESHFEPATGMITFAGRTLPFQLAEKATAFETSFPLAPTLALEPLALSNPLRRLLFTRVKLETRPQVVQSARLDRGYLVQRRYAKLDDTGAEQDLAQLRVGDSVVVSLRIEVRQPAHYLAVDDALPAIFEAINPVFKSHQSRTSGAPVPPASSSENWLSDFQELRTDRALFFRNHLPPGSYTIRYLARVRAAGVVTAPATKVEEMYHPERFGLSDTVQLTSLPME